MWARPSGLVRVGSVAARRRSPALLVREDVLEAQVVLPGQVLRLDDDTGRAGLGPRLYLPIREARIMDIDRPSTLYQRGEGGRGDAADGGAFPRLTPAKACCCGCTLRSGIQLASLFELVTGCVQVFVYLRFLSQGVTSHLPPPPPPKPDGEPADLEAMLPRWLIVVMLFLSVYTCVVGGYGLRATNSYLATHHPSRLTTAAGRFAHIVGGKFVLYVLVAVLQTEVEGRRNDANFKAMLVIFSLWYLYLWFIAWSYHKWLVEVDNALPQSVRTALQTGNFMQAAPPAQEMARVEDSNTAFGIPCDNEGFGGGWSNTPFDGSGGVIVVHIGALEDDSTRIGRRRQGGDAAASTSADAHTAVNIDGGDAAPYGPFQPAASWRGVPVGMVVEWHDPPDAIGQPYTTYPPDSADRPSDSETVTGHPRFPAGARRESNSDNATNNPQLAAWPLMPPMFARPFAI